MGAFFFAKMVPASWLLTSSVDLLSPKTSYALTLGQQVLVLWDLNVWLQDATHHQAQAICHDIAILGLSQCVESPTHVTSQILDVVFSANLEVNSWLI